MTNLKDQIDPKRLPGHVAVIMDGNGRWAKEQGKNRIFGHQNGVEAVRNTAEAAAELGVANLTVYAFSTENWNRPKEEVNALMELFVATIQSELSTLQNNKIALKSIGDVESLPTRCYNDLKDAEAQTKSNERMNLILAVSYSARWDICNAVKQISADVKQGLIDPLSIDEKTIQSHLTTRNFPEPALLIRTGGEKRISNFLLWEMAYTEFYFTEKHWPEFTKDDFHQAILDFQSRERRFGKISEQIKC